METIFKKSLIWIIDSRDDALMRPLTKSESAAVKILEFCNIDCSIIHFTKTALNKGYTDATDLCRQFLKRNNIHDFSTQAPGEESIKYVKAICLSSCGPEEVTVSLQRPATGGGRFFRLSKIGSLKHSLNIQVDDLVLQLVLENRLCLLNITCLAERDGVDEQTLIPPDGNGEQTIILGAKNRVLHVMSCMPSCKSGVGSGASANDIGELTGMLLKSNRLAVSSSILEELLYERKVELRSTKPKKYRLCH